MTEYANPDFNANELIPVIVQHAVSKEVLMLAYMNNTAYQETLRTGQAHFWSRSRNTLWHKGATSGNFQDVTEIHVDCDEDALLLLVLPDGPACHTGQKTCFYRQPSPVKD